MPARIFISYSHDSLAHEARVLALANRLRADGVDAVIDQYEPFPPKGWKVWMRRQIKEAQFVVAVCTETYRRRAEGDEEPGTGRGVTREGCIIDQHVYDASGHNEKFIPVIVGPADANQIPEFLRPYQFFVLDQQYEDLYRLLTNQPKTTKPVLGPLQALAPRESRPEYRAIWNIPHRNPFFSGRDKYLEELHQALASSGTAALTQAIKGLGGIGKTQTAIEYAHRYRDDYRAALWLTADSKYAVVSGFAALAPLLGIPQEQDLAALAHKCRAWFDTNTGWLLVLDNVDDLSHVNGWIPPTGHVIITTRLRVLGKVAKEIGLPKMSPDEGAKFLLQRAKIENPSPADREAALELAREVDGLPLALEQAGAYIEGTSSPATYLRLYRAEGTRLRAKKGDDAHDSVTVTYTLAFEKLSDRAKDLVRQCAFLAPDAIPEELLTAGNEADVDFWDAVAEAGKYSLLERNAAGDWEMHRLVQDVVRDGMDKVARRQWAEGAVEIVNSAFPTFEFENWPQCERLLPHARAAAQWISEFGIEAANAARLMIRTADYIEERAQYREAESLYRRALEVLEHVLGNEHPETLSTVNNLAYLLKAKGDLSGAEPLYRRTLETRERVLGTEHPDTLASVNNLAVLLRVKGDLEEAEPLCRRAMEARDRLLGKEHPDTLKSVNNLAVLLNIKGDLAGAEPLHRRELEACERVLGKEHPETLISVNNLAPLLEAKGDPAGAEPLYRRAMEGFRRALGEDHPTTKAVANNHAQCLAELHKR